MIPARHLFANWSSVAARLREARRIALFLDFDGTLTPLRPRPEDVRLSTHMRRVISTLQRSPGVRVIVISGRRRADVRARIRIPGVRYLGLHGWEGRRSLAVSEETRARMECLKVHVTRFVKEMPGTWVEDKDVVATIHHAQAAPRDIARIREEMVHRLQELGGAVRGIAGERCFELASAEVEDKGAAVSREWTSVGRAALPVFVGDDMVDEPAFIALAKGITVRVGSPAPTHAHYRVSDVPEVRLFLQRLTGEVSKTAGDRVTGDTE